MFRGIGPRMAAAFVGLALGSILLVSLAINWSLSARFDNYVRANQDRRGQALAETLASYYLQAGGWSSGAAMQMMHWAYTEGVEAALFDSEGKLLAQTRGGPAGGPGGMMPGMMGGPGGMMGGMMGGGRTGPGGMMGPPWNQGGEGYRGGAGSSGTEGPTYVSDVPIMVNGQPVGMLKVTSYGPQGFWSPQDMAFRSALNRTLLYTGLTAAGLALLLSLAITRKLSTPLLELTRAAQAMRRGSLSPRVRVRGSDELAQLGEAFNHLAESLAAQERLRKKLTADVAHELRTPLATMRSHLEAFQDGVWEPTPERLETCHEEVMRLVRLVGDLEQLTAAESEALSLKKGKVDLGSLVAQIGSSYRPLFDSKKVSLEMLPGGGAEVIRGGGVEGLPGRDLQVLADRDKLSQVIVNLLANALKFTPEGGKVILAAEAQGDRARISVKDTGIGIPAADLPHIFERFYRGEKSRNRATGGAGIGLAIAKALTDAHGGRIEVRSEPGEGSEFIVSLPLFIDPSKHLH